ncbi:MAG: substrate-binding domain-containing protein [Desulfurivibrionaceae bacterium]|jgi:phosphonate transport system substrate-binding protein|nr:PhnD/SsuA/transferrin family substrate-binding protein [Pseudomonadota bacterium]MCG2823837.1 PhnD/SsuA/transferrin family substrate-binding protein [Desulfobulbaceae bacterium]MDP2003331.1 PhnD/SsuA/transferrin family substrate-binding protein [Desulfurivibrionaceae bacterium]PKN23588.1 MAG: phosphate/phosphite/phosphonate ABC transporter substrate-binding protein [Deltaproteobacteria bacterium HGW-Deltaproteobacteria-3]MBU4229593.1 PhnD/SsuA/transferrin family substrate-binding protein [Ps
MTAQTKKRLVFCWGRVIGLGFLFFLLAGCEVGQQEKAEPERQLRLDNLTQLPDGQTDPDSQALRIGVAAILSPQGTVLSYQPLIDYLGRKMDKPAILVQRKTYQELNDLLARNVVDLGFICTGAYLEGARNGTMSLLVVPQINGKTTYRSFFIVPAASPARELGDLRGKVFAFTDPLSNTGYRYPLSLLQDMGQQPETFFGRTIFTYSHDRSIAAVMEGITDGASVDSLVYQFAGKRNPEILRRTKVIWESPDFGIPPVVVPRIIAPAKKALLKELLLGMHHNAEGEKALAVFGVDRFVEPPPGLYGL